MIIKSQAELTSLDEEIPIFDEVTWDFFNSPCEFEGDNFEYFDDIRDIAFEETDRTNVKRWMAIAIMLITFISMLVFSVQLYIRNSRIEELLALQEAKNIVSSLELQRIDGTIADNDSTVSVSKLLQNYFTIVRNKKSYEKLNDFCSTSSNFEDTYNSFTSKIESSYDVNDSSARAFRQLGGMCKVDQINTLLIKDDVYYCYVSISCPTTDNVCEYIFENTYNITKYFTRNSITDENIAKLFVSLINEEQITLKSKEFCLKLEKTKNGFKLLDDSEITSICLDAYTMGLKQMSRVVQR